MESLITNAVDSITNLMSNFGVISGVLLIMIESILPILPLGVFIALNVITFGEVTGFIISWISTVIGCMLAFSICRKLKEKFDKKYRKDSKVKKFRKKIDKLSLSSLVLIIAVPFTPAFAINIGAGLSNIDPKRYLLALLIGKLPMVFFWGFIGKSFLESISDPYTMAQIIVMLILAYLVSKVINNFIK
ncbi:MAG: TVP38/TMEM64 family protein [Bacilli bacterium]|nr:TVP38/TMEM64 family protein [Bacilli bacterium]